MNCWIINKLIFSSLEEGEMRHSRILVVILWEKLEEGL
jgi:hypothetical protein